MNRHTFGKWMLASVAMAFAYACQPSKPEKSEPKSSSCGCTSSKSADNQTMNECAPQDATEETALQIIEITEEQDVAELKSAEESAEDVAAAVSVIAEALQSSEPAAETVMLEIPLMEAVVSEQVVTQAESTVAVTTSENQ